MMPGPTWYAHDIFSGTLHVPAGEMTAAMPLRWNNEPLVTGQVGGGPWVVSKHTKNMAAAIDFVKWVTTSLRIKAKAVAPGYPSYGPAADRLAEEARQGPVLRRSSEGPAMKAAANLGLAGLEHGHLPGPARLVEQRRHAARRREVV